MVALDHLRGAAAGRDALDHVRVERALGQERRALELRRLAVEDVDEEPPDGLALVLRVGDPGQGAQEKLSRINVDQRDVVVIPEEGDDLVGLVQPHQAGVDEDAGELLADGLVNQHRGHRAIDAAGKAADHAALAHLGADALDGLVLEPGHGPVALQPGDLVGEVAVDQRPARGVRHLGVELHPIEPPRLVGDDGVGGARRGGDHLEAGRHGGDLVAVAHPHRLFVADVAEAGQQGRLPGDADLGAAELAGVAALHRPAQLRAHGHLAVAYPQHRHAQREDGGRRGRALGLVGAGRAAGEDHRLGGEALQHGRHFVVGVDLAVDPALAHPPGDQLGDLAAEIDDQHALVVGLRHGADVGENRAYVSPPP